MSQNDIELVQSIYQWFSKGNVAAILEKVHAHARWDFAVSHSEVPWHRPVSGTEVAAFLQAFGENVDLHQFEPRHWIASAGDVIAHVAIAYTVRKTGKRVEMDQLHWWTIQDGKVLRLRHFEDTAQVLSAWAA